MVADRYVIDDILGSGGMSVVYRAHDTKLDRYVTLKILKEDYLADEALLARFPKEARAAAALNHQNITSIFDHGRDGDVLYIVLEYVDGASLKELIVKKAPFGDETNLGVAIQVAEGLSEAHDNKIIHLDIKPQNILVTSTSIVKVADFGIARAAKSVTLNAAAGSMGSVHYFSPEQARGGYIDHKSDIYSLGIVMYEMATGELPFDGENEISVALQHINDPLPDISKINPNVSESLIRIIRKATEKSASKRYETVVDMIEDLKRALTDASGAFVDVDDDDELSETKRITEENKTALRRRKARSAFLDGTDEDDESPNFLLRDEAHEEPDIIPKRKGKVHHIADYSSEGSSYYSAFQEPRNKNADRVSVFGGIILGLIFGIPIIIGAVFIYGRWLSPAAGMIETPNVIGMTRFLAEMEAINSDILLEFTEEHCGLQSPFRDEMYICGHELCGDGWDCQGTIIFQGTDAGTMIRPGDVLHVVLSAGRAGEGELMPLVEMFTLDDARAVLDALDIHVNIETREHHGIGLPNNIVYSQDPPPGTLLTNNAVIILTVTPDQDDIYVAVPHLVGITPEQAIEILRQHSLIAISESEHSDTFPAGSIIRQDPRSGETVERDRTSVTFFVSTGPESPTSEPDEPEVTPEPEATPEPTPDPTPSPTPTPEATPSPTPVPEATPTPSPTPEATPSPTPVPEATPSPTPQETPSDSPPAMNSCVLTVQLWSGVPEDAETVHLQIFRQTGNAEAEMIHNNHERVDQFPRSFTITYSGPSVFHIVSVENGTPRTVAMEPRPRP